jgi:GH24 family phage-related lysozyme (muramidase)
MLVKQGDAGDTVKALQRGLDKLGSILLVDGDFGPATRDAVADACVIPQRPGPPEADDAPQQAVMALPDPFPPLMAPGVTFIARAEIASPQAYRRHYKHPIWPSGESGITIGIGYDLQFVGRTELQEDWGDHLSPDVIRCLSTVLQVRGSAERLASVRDVEVPLLAAMAVLMQCTLPRYLDETRAIYPQVDDLSPARRMALVSLIYNRGRRLEDSDPVRQDRREVRQIQHPLATGNAEAVAEQRDPMSRLWDPDKLPGLIQRRHDEARLWRSGFETLQLA